MVRKGNQRVGVVKVKFGLTTVDSVLAQGSSNDRALRVDLTDSTGHLIASSVPTLRFVVQRGDSTTPTSRRADPS